MSRVAQIGLPMSSGNQNTGKALSSAALAASLVLRNSPGTLIHLSGYNSGGDQFIQIHDAAALPANGAVPFRVFKVFAASNFSFEVPLTGEFYGTGIVVCNSSTAPTKTIGAADCWFNAVIL